jgi:HD-GYP domain-containing protein (c-di-GMP phosphodiesterase class II)
MTSNRIYRGRICPFEVIKQFEVSSYGELDTGLLLIFLKNIAYTYFGSWVRLSDGREAEIVYIHQNDLSRPIVRCDGEMIDIQKVSGITITDAL